MYHPVWTSASLSPGRLGVDGRAKNGGKEERMTPPLLLLLFANVVAVAVAIAIGGHLNLKVCCCMGNHFRGGNARNVGRSVEQSVTHTIKGVK